MRFLSGLLWAIIEVVIAAGLVYTRHVECPVLVTNLATGLVVVWVALAIVEVFCVWGACINSGELLEAAKLNEEQKETHANHLRIFVTGRSAVGGFIRGVSGILMIFCLAAVGWFTTAVLWVLGPGVARWMLSARAGEKTKKLAKKLQLQKEEGDNKG